MKTARGFTLLELMIVVAIITIMMVAGLPSLITWLGNTRVRSAADGLQNGLRLAQVEAIRRNSTVTFRLTSASPVAANSTASASGVNWLLLDSSGALIQFKDLEGSTNLSQTATGGSGFAGDIVFNGLGTNNIGSTIQFKFATGASDHPLVVLLTPAGRVRMCDPTRAAGDPQACA